MSVCVTVREAERERQTDRETETETQTQTQTQTDRDRDRERERERESVRETGRQRERLLMTKELIIYLKQLFGLEFKMYKGRNDIFNQPTYSSLIRFYSRSSLP